MICFISTIGFIGNILSLIVLTRPSLKQEIFHQLLMTLASFDILLVITFGINTTEYVALGGFPIEIETQISLHMK